MTNTNETINENKGREPTSLDVLTEGNIARITRLEKLKRQSILRAKVIANCIEVRQIEEKYPKMLVAGIIRPVHAFINDPVFYALVERRSCCIEVKGLFGKKKFFLNFWFFIIIRIFKRRQRTHILHI